MKNVMDEKDRNLMPFVVSKRHKKTYQRTQYNKFEKNNTWLEGSPPTFESLFLKIKTRMT